MRFTTFLPAAAALVASLTLMAAGPAPEATQQPNTYFACPRGYTFQVNNGAARCFIPGRTLTAQALCLVPGMTKYPDSIGNSDYCKPAGIGAGVAVGCTPAYGLSVRRGLDVCVRQNPPTIRAPTTAVSR